MSLTALGSYLISRQRVTSNEQNKRVLCKGSDKITIINICSSHIIADQSMVKNGFFKIYIVNTGVCPYHTFFRCYYYYNLKWLIIIISNIKNTCIPMSRYYKNRYEYVYIKYVLNTLVVNLINTFFGHIKYMLSTSCAYNFFNNRTHHK